MKKGVAYSHEEKIAILQEHTEHHRTLKEICEEYGISKSYLCYLLKQYRESGKKRIAATKYYSEEFKLGIVKQHYEGGTAIAKLVKETGSRYAKEGYAGLTTRKQPKPPVETQLQFTRNTSTISFFIPKGHRSADNFTGRRSYFCREMRRHLQPVQHHIVGRVRTSAPRFREGGD